MAELTAADPRVRWFDNPKGPRHGELHRHAALQEARGEIVCYLCDDDLWLPDHVERMRALLDGARLRVHAPVLDRPRGRDPLLQDRPAPAVLPRALPRRREPDPALVRRAHARPLPAAAGRLAHDARGHVHRPLHVAADPLGPRLSRRRATPRRPCSTSRARSGSAGARRSGSTSSTAGPRDCEEPGFRAELTERVLAATSVDAARPRSRRPHACRAEASDLAGRLAEAEAEYHRLAAWATGLEDDLRQLSASVTWRLRARLLAIPGLRRPVRGAARALAGRAAPGAAGSERPGPTPEP